MLKELLLVALMAVCLTGAVTPKSHTADMEFLLKQKRVYELLLFVKQPTLIDAEWYEIGRGYDIENNIEMYKDKEIVQEFLWLWKKGMMLRKDAIFTPLIEEQRDEMYLLLKLLVTAKDFQTFYKTACWARLYINDGVFTTALTVAVFNRPDCKYLRLPAPYEIYPNLFFDSRVIQEAHKIQMTRGVRTVGMDNIDTYTIWSNYTGRYVRPYGDDEYLLDYFMEDIGLNTYYYYVRMVMPFWLNSKDWNIPKEIRGVMYWWIHKELINRYNLERITHGLPEMEVYDWYKKLYPGYYSTLMYSNGIMMPQRDRWTSVPYYKHKYLKEIEAVEFRILSAIDSGFVIDPTGKQISIYTPEGLNILGNIIEGNRDSCNRRYYGIHDVLVRDVLSGTLEVKDKNKLIPGALGLYSTSMRDPAFYRLYDRILSFFERYKRLLPRYTINELIFPGVKIESVSVDKLTTMFETCDSLINNAVAVENLKEGTSLRIRTRRQCLTNKPFTYRIIINSDKDTKGVVKIFLGPASEEKFLDMTHFRKYYKYFVQMDRFVVTLRSGVNNIERRSTDSIFTMPDLVSSDVYYKKLLKAVGGSEPFSYYERIFGFPERLILPKGRPEGMKYQLYVIVYPFDEGKVSTFELPIFGKMMLDGKPLGYPLDRPMNLWKFLTPNMLLKDVWIYHTTETDKMMMMRT